MAKRKEASFEVTKFERGLIEQIVGRAQGEGLVRGKASPGHWYDGVTATMDLTACHANGCRLDFKRLLNADGFNFVHDIAGIARHMDRETGKLTGFFRPRFAERKAMAEAV